MGDHGGTPLHDVPLRLQASISNKKADLNPVLHDRKQTRHSCFLRAAANPALHDPAAAAHLISPSCTSTLEDSVEVCVYLY
jgi:inosine-uridine nucleoside N-ribohydrolase